MIEEKKPGRPRKGVIQVTFTLEPEVAEFLNHLPSGEKSEFANDALKVAIAHSQKCSMCDQPADLKCEIGTCEPITWYCSYHYMIKHHPEDDEEE